jgi:uncharacterized Tic20 family protein
MITLQAYGLAIFSGALATIVLLLAGILVWKSYKDSELAQKEKAEEAENAKLSIEDIRRRNAALTLAQIVSADNARFSAAPGVQPGRKSDDEK